MSRQNSGSFFLFLIVLVFLALSACSGGGSSSDGDLQPDADADPEDGDDSDGDDSEFDVDEDLPTEADIEADGDDESDGDGEADEADEAEEEGDAERQPGAVLEVVPSPVVFDLVELGSSAESGVVLRNVQEQAGGQTGLTVSSFILTTSSSKDIAIAPGCSAPFDIAAGEEKSCTLLCSPSSPRLKSATLRIVASDGINDPREQRIAVNCNVAHQISYVESTTVEFGFTSKGMSQSWRFFVANPASINLEVSDVRLSDDTPSSFGLSFPERALQAATLAPNELVEFEISYLPTARLSEVGWLEIESDDPFVPLRIVPLTGRASFVCPNEAPNLENDSCVDLCIPRQRICEFDEESSSYSVSECSEDGSAWQNVESCPADTVCLDGYCVIKACESGALMCRENGVLSCAENELGFVEEDGCGSDDMCMRRSCTPGIGCGEEDTSSRCDDGNVCTSDTCDVERGCRFEFNNDGCDDANPCTVNDSCLLGRCLGVALSCDDGNVCTSDFCDQSVIGGDPCVHQNIEGRCSDASACTSGDVCIDGQCVGSPVGCDDGNFCTDDSCDPTLGCVFTPNNRPCNDNNACTENDVCFNGVCRGSAIVFDDGKFCNGVETCNPGGAGIIAGAPPLCDDGISCTVDSCSDSANACLNAPDNTLCDDHNSCTIDTCSASKGCVYNPKPNFSPCDFLPGVEEICFDGLCTHSCTSHADCNDGIPCTADNCDFSVGLCRNVPRHDLCQDESVCNGLEICNPVIGCISGEFKVCDDGFACTIDYCSEEAGGCVHVPNNSSCNDYNICTVDICSVSEGCRNLPISRKCDDGNACTVGDTCSAGICVSGSGVPYCNDGNPCTNDWCNPVSGCMHSSNAAACSDGNLCTSGSYCSDGACIPGVGSCDDGVFCNGIESCSPDDGSCRQATPPDCDDKIDCTRDECNAGIDACLHSPVNEDCDDGNPCTVEYCDIEMGCVFEDLEDGLPCEGGYCYNGYCSKPCTADSDCNDAIDCTTDICDTGIGLCTHGVNDEICRNSIYCDGEEYCDVLKGCSYGKPVDCEDGLACTRNICTEEGCQVEITDYCNDGNSCTEDICDPSINPLLEPSGCRYNILDGASCNDGNACTISDVCSAGQCFGTPKNCDDGNPCTAEYCGGDGQCQSVQLANGSLCGGGKVCLWGNCVSGCRSDSDCNSDGIACTVEVCNPESLECQSVPFDKLCDNGKYCDGNEYCSITQGCMPGTQVECDDGIGCTVDYCDERTRSCRFEADDAVCADPNPCVDSYCSLSNDCVYAYNTNSCNDGNPCTVNDRCSDGVCSGSVSASLCDDGNLCTSDSCDPDVGCLHVDVSNLCDDDNVCTLDSCSPALGCVFSAVESMACDDGNACTEMDYCQNGYCKSFAKLDCEDYNPCTVDSCSSTGGCVHTYAGDDASCDLGPTLSGEVCRNGVCTVACLDASECDDGITCTLDGCQGGYCVNTPRDQLCDDGIFCNGAETCLPNYGCRKGEAPSCDDSVACTRDWCDVGLDECVNLLTDELCEDGNPCTADSCNASGCTNEALSDVACDDGNLCTLNDMCIQGTCSGSLRNCDDYNDCTGPDVCDPAVGCRYPLVADGVECGPSEAALTCIGGICTAQCDYDYQCDDGVDCTFDSCDSLAHICRFVPQNSRCDDGIFCNGVEICHATMGCIDAESDPCDDLLFCTDDSCDEQNRVCTHVPVNARCDDNNECTAQSCVFSQGCVYTITPGVVCSDNDPCTTLSRCSVSGRCQQQTLTDCSTENPCSPGKCETGLGCVQDFKADGTHCYSSDSCVPSARCIAGQCVPSLMLRCDDENECTEDVCDQGGCINAASMSPSACNDDLRCTVNEHCGSGQCVGSPADCDDDNTCTADQCSEDDGCVHIPTNEGLSCANPVGGSAGDGLCREGACVAVCIGNQDCDDGFDCTIDVCDGGRCRYIAQHALCDDGLFCNGQELCLVGKGCSDNIPVECRDKVACTNDYCDEQNDVCVNEASAGACDDGNPCTVDVCDPLHGCIHQDLDGVPCDDVNACTLGGVCLAGFCASRQKVRCDDDNPCTKDTCDPVQGCIFVPMNGIDCNDGNFCTVNDRCADGECVGVAASCDDFNQCTYDYCDKSVGCINLPLTWSPCDDNNACTVHDFCFDGQCRGYGSPECDDNNSCTLDRCLPQHGCVFKTLPPGECKK